VAEAPHEEGVLTELALDLANVNEAVPNAEVFEEHIVPTPPPYAVVADDTEVEFKFFDGAPFGVECLGIGRAKLCMKRGESVEQLPSGENCAQDGSASLKYDIAKLGVSGGGEDTRIAGPPNILIISVPSNV